MASQQNGTAMALARGLGWFSIGLGLAEMLAPRMLTEQMGMKGKEGLLRFYGAREMAAGIGILMSDNPGPWVWGRVAGDALDLATLATGLDQQNPRKGTVAIALAAVAGVTALDCISAQALTGTSRPVPDYSDRRGLPRPPEEMRGAARKDFTPPRDMRTSEALKPFTSRSPSERPSMEHSRA
ncbi:MAG: cyclase dehydrase [Stellaceae bacterium]